MKVFISSVIEGFEKERAAAKKAVESLRMEPVMAESFSAKPYSAQVACLEGVAQSDIYLGLVGRRYGHVTKAGISVTVEEFNEARSRGMPVLWFVENCEREEKQEEFLATIKDYEGGYYIGSFDSEVDLLPKIVQGLNDVRAELEGANTDSKEATRLRNGYIKALREVSIHGTTLGVIVFPAAKRVGVLSAGDLESSEVRDKAMEAALFGKDAVFDTGMGTCTVEGRDYVRFVQNANRDVCRNAIMFDVYGALVLGMSVGSDDRGMLSKSFLFDMHVIDEELVAERLTGAIKYAGRFYDEIVKVAGGKAVYVNAVLMSLESKKFGRRPKVPPNSMSIGFGGMEDPLAVPEEPMRVVQEKLEMAADVVSELMAQIRRAFKAEGLYYEE